MKKLLLIIFFFSTQVESSCRFNDVYFSDHFANAKLDRCKQKSGNRYLLTIDPENTPINSSPWYAFQVQSKKSKWIRIQIDFGEYKSRYLPKVSTDGHNWSPIRHKIKKGDLFFNLRIGPKAKYIAGQEIINNKHYINWLSQLSIDSPYKFSELGKSEQNRSIYQLESLSPSNEWVIFMGRMHPPEITGALALFPFVTEVLKNPNNNLAKSFRQRFNILVIPNLNPDGVEHGHWRHNINGKDLNRDWKQFQQKETQIVKSKFDSIIKAGGKIVYAIDFHSTRQNIFYTMPHDYGLKPARITEDWLDLLEDETPEFVVKRKAGNNPDRGVFKQFIADTYGVHAITYEMGDNYSRKKIIKVAKIAANTFMKILLGTAKNEFD